MVILAADGRYGSRFVCVCVCVCGCGCVYCCMYQKYLGQFPRKLPHGYIIKCYKNASRLNRYNFPTVNAIDFLFSTLHTISFHCGVANFGTLHQFFADATSVSQHEFMYCVS